MNNVLSIAAALGVALCTELALAQGSPPQQPVMMKQLKPDVWAGIGGSGGNSTIIIVDGVKLELYHWAPAHTSGDLVVYLPDQKIAATGDIITANRADDNPNIHMDKNGSAEGWITNVKGIAGLNADVYVPGHGDLQMKSDIQRKLNAVIERRAKIAAMVKQGKSLEEIKAALPDNPAPGARAAAPPAGAAPGGRGPAPGFVDAVYAELTRKS
jgi:glyoxylase-like metal-dependent hydrolase (beta-lactamase superfamily II)